MKESSKMIWKTEKGLRLMIQAMYTSENLKKIKNKDVVRWNGKTRNMMDSGLMENLKALAQLFGWMRKGITKFWKIDTKANGIEECVMGSELFFMLTEVSMKECGKTIKNTDKPYLLMKMDLWVDVPLTKINKPLESKILN